ncbi:hypothetical protein PR202_gb10229 [Eleusine coracana subsp. coracana]|uniref:FRIGIDA-like protein n=1 Tax=Eleusine coracana subsp. coracana TaxID=191504 RepID=A0AAV5EJU8_ELECO|nr:hypothetical protein QOZ80_3BG0253170 [Eleusine coracana subsp. coracana]GJN22642.1 hypothetical protein PR202_gb10229 [Eleusine coracana subsp. coracana]
MAPPSPPPAATAAASASCAAVLHSVNSLASYSDALANFLDQWNSVLLDVASIAATFAAHFPGPKSDPKPVPELNPAPEQEQEPVPERDPAPEPEREVVPEPQPKPSPNPERERERKDEDPAAAAQLGLLCEKMSPRDLRRFLTARLADREWLRVVGPDALRRAPDPAVLVLRAVGRYYICAESRDAEAACVLLLELYVRGGCPRRPGQGETELQEEAREAVLTWRSRLVRVRGRLSAAGTREARGLILFMAAFGVPIEFPPQELYDLLTAANSLSCTKVLRCSKLFVKTMRDVVVEMLNRNMYLQAIRIILAFEFQNAFPLAPTLTHIMEKVEHDRKRESEELPLKERDEEELALLRLTSKCVEDQKLCPSEFSSFGIAERIALLEERVGQPKQAFTGTKRKRTTAEVNVQ